MKSNFRKTFKPTKKEKAEFYEMINKMIQEDINKNGHHCRNCAHSKHPVNNPFDNATYCDVSDHVTESYEIYTCEQHEFIGWLGEN